MVEHSNLNNTNDESVVEQDFSQDERVEGELKASSKACQTHFPTAVSKKERRKLKTIQSLSYNPNFQLTPEVIEVLKEVYVDFANDQDGCICRNDLLTVLQQLESRDVISGDYLEYLERGINGDKQAHDPIHFDEFCEIVVRWRYLSPHSLEVVYNSWMKSVAADFGDGDGFVRGGDELIEIEVPKKSLLRTDDLDKMKFVSRNSIRKDGVVVLPQNVDDAYVTISKSFIAGGLAGIISKSCLAPIDRVKIMFQATPRKFTFSNAVSLGKQIYVKDGFLALFRGNSATVLRVIPYAGIQHASYDYFKRGFMSYNSKRHASNTSGVEKESFVSSKLSHTQTIVAGSLAGGLSVLCTYPLDIVRARLVVQEGKLGRGGLMDAMVSMYRAGGLQSFTRGLAPTLLGILPYTGVGFALNEALLHEFARFQNRHIEKEADKKRLGTFSKFSCSYVAACVAQSVTYPLDTVRRRMQTDGLVSGGNGHTYTNIVGASRIILQQEGWRGLYKGLMVNWLRSPVATGLSLTVYDIFKEALGIKRM